ncbi:MAG: glutamate-1-semialdehyde 2,1-aminomutase [Fimbriimonas sp.]|nr:glutamate-1-semialdehyde 2,1-aminomutase [Fimbriimonas sp.]
MNCANRPTSESLYAEACGLMPGGVNSPVRAFKAVAGTPVFFKNAKGSRLFDADGNEYVDYVSSWGAILLGHADDRVVRAIADAAANGTSFGAPHEGEVRLAREILGRVPAVEMVRFVNSGTEATLATIRLVRAATGRNKIVKFEGNYHGAVDSLLAKAGSGIATFGLPDSAGVPKSITHDTLLARYNDSAHVEAILEANSNEVAAVMVEPIAGNMGLVPPDPGFLLKLREICDHHGVLLVFDEVMTGFRVAKGGASERYGIKPDLVCMGKVIGGGLPVGAYGGRKELMNLVAPIGPMYQAGTLSGNPLAMAAGYAALSNLDDASYDLLEHTGARLEAGLNQVFGVAGVPAQVQRVGSMISVFLTSEPVHNYDEAGTTDKPLFAKLFHSMLDKGFYLPPSALEAWFLTTSHTNEDIDRTVEAFAQSLKDVAA